MMMRGGLGIILLIAAALVVGIMIVEWLAGCGEPTYFASGVWETNECLFIPYETASGNWKS